MKTICSTRSLCVFAILLVVLAATGEDSFMRIDDRYPTCWEPIWWAPMELADACRLPSQSVPDTGLYNQTIVGRDIFARYGYPYHYALIAGINDTLDALVTFYRVPVQTDFDLTGQKVEQWFAPQIYMNLAKGRDPTMLLMDSTQIGYRMRGWTNGWEPLPAPTKLHAESWGSDYGHYNIKLDIWKLPQGHFQLCLLPTDKIPGDFHPIIGGEIMEFYPARDLADSCNGYEGNFWRATYDSNFSAAANWVQKILTINPKAVPGHWLLARNSLDLQDTSAAKDAYDKAIDYLNTGADPAMPDSTKGPLREFERKYIDCMKVVLPYERAQLGP
jgi:hypothetical protein